jgi:glycosyltransferase involved in cell wall biosynthesis
MPEKIIKKLIKLSNDKGVEKQVNILPKVKYEKIRNYLKISDIGIIPLPPEIKWWRVSAPLKTLEYLAAKKPIIATNIPFHCKIFEKVNCGILIKSGSPETIAIAIKKIYENKNELKKMGEDGRKIVEKYYTWEVMAEKMEKFLTQLSN